MESKRWRIPWTEVHVPRVIETVAFWCAIILPFVYLPLLFAGLNSGWSQLLFASLVALNAVMIVLGHRHGQ